jgi:nicotinate-nucleotide pyrophosphorylase (carboxylating)
LKGIEGAILEAVKKALDEDSAAEDITSRLLVPEGLSGRARIIARAAGVISGQQCARAVFNMIDQAVEYVPAIRDGGKVEEGAEVASIMGSLRSILSGERTALNFLGHLSGVATRTAEFVERIRGTGVTLLDTRKTTPGLRLLEKRAVSDGGGRNHRPDLVSYLLVKENHIEAAGGIAAMLARMGPAVAKAEIEVRSLEELKALKEHPPERIMLDNFTPAKVVRAIEEVDSWGEARPEIEVSGGIRLDNIKDYAIEGVDFISSGSITSSAVALDLSLLVDALTGGEA